jgi:hypothetical protein
MTPPNPGDPEPNSGIAACKTRGQFQPGVSAPPPCERNALPLGHAGPALPIGRARGSTAQLRRPLFPIARGGFRRSGHPYADACQVRSFSRSWQPVVAHGAGSCPQNPGRRGGRSWGGTSNAAAPPFPHFGSRNAYQGRPTGGRLTLPATQVAGSCSPNRSPQRLRQVQAPCRAGEVRGQDVEAGGQHRLRQPAEGAVLGADVLGEVRPGCSPHAPRSAEPPPPGQPGGEPGPWSGPPCRWLPGVHLGA